MSSSDINLSGRKILVVCPKFFGYETRVVNQLRARGALVEFADERPGNSPLDKVLIRIQSRLIRPKIRRHYASILERYKDSAFDDILFISPECCNEPILDAFRASYPRTRLLLYMWDSLKNKGHHDPAGFLAKFDRTLSFDREDCRNYDIPLRPLFFSEAVPEALETPNEYAFSFVGTIHSDRYRVLRAMCEAADGLGLTYFVYPYLPSRLHYWLYRWVKPEFKGKRKSDFKFAPLAYSEVMRVMRSSVAIIDVEHPMQRGLTMRTFEVLGAVKKLATTNRDIANYPFYDPARIMVIDRQAPHLDARFFRLAAEPLEESFVSEFSLNGWIDSIFRLN